MLGELKVAGLTSFTVFTVSEQFSCGTVTARKLFSRHGRAVTSKERDVMRAIREEGTWATGLFLSGVALSAFEFGYSLNMVCIGTWVYLPCFKHLVPSSE